MQADEVKEREEHERQFKEVSDNPNRMLLWALQKAKDYRSRDEEEGASERPPQGRISQSEPMDADADLVSSGSLSGKVRRNDPGPCGSGRKFKKCCMKKKRSDNPFN